jgi:hypothetical protein
MVVDLHNEKRQHGEATPYTQRAHVKYNRRHCQTSIQSVASRAKWFYASNRSGCGAVTGRPYRAAPMNSRIASRFHSCTQCSITTNPTSKMDCSNLFWMLMEAFCCLAPNATIISADAFPSLTPVFLVIYVLLVQSEDQVTLDQSHPPNLSPFLASFALPTRCRT